MLLLDINGLFCRKVLPPYPEGPIAGGLETLQLSAYRVEIRTREFLAACYDQYTIAFFSSTTEYNGSVIVEALLTPKQKAATAFFWYRDRTRLDPDFGKDDRVEWHSTIKILDDVFANPQVNCKRLYGPHNTVLCDDSAFKTRFNNPYNIVVAESFGGLVDDSGLGPILDKIEDRFIMLSLCGQTCDRFRELAIYPSPKRAGDINPSGAKIIV